MIGLFLTIGAVSALSLPRGGVVARQLRIAVLWGREGGGLLAGALRFSSGWLGVQVDLVRRSLSVSTDAGFVRSSRASWLAVGGFGPPLRSGRACRSPLKTTARTIPSE